MSDIYKHNRTMNSGSAYAADAPRDPAAVMPGAPVSGVADHTARRSRKNVLMEAVNQFPFHIAGLVSVPTAVVVMTIANGASFYRAMGASILQGEPVGAILTVALASYSLLATLTVSSIRETLDRKTRDREADARSTQIGNGAVQIVGSVAAISAEVRDLLRMVRDQGSQQQDLAQMVTDLLVQHKPQTIQEPNTTECWGPLCPGSEFYSIAGQLRGDIETEMLPNGRQRLVPQVHRFEEAWLPRFSEGTAVRRANYVLFVGDADMFGDTAPDPIRYHLYAFRVLKQIAASRGVPLMLDRVRFAIRRSNDPHLCHFVGVYDRGGAKIPFTASYFDNSIMFRVPKGVLDERVSISFAPDLIDAHLHNAKAMMASSPTYSLDELEHHFGALVEHPDLKLPQPAAANSQPSFPWVENGDHFG